MVLFLNLEVPLSNTGHKCISASFDTDGDPWRYQITVQWEGERKNASLRGGSLEEALEIRRSFELELDKPRTERHIRSNQVGVYLSEDSYGNKSWVAHLVAGGRDVRKHFGLKKYGKEAYPMAVIARRKMLIEAGEAA